MAGTRTAPIIGALTVTENLISIRTVDASEDLHSEPIKVIGGGLADMAEIEALTAAYQAATQASVYEVAHTAVWTGSINPTNAQALFRGGVEDGINLGFNDTDVFNSQFGFRLVAPVAATMVSNSDQPVVPIVTPMSELVAALITLAGAGFSLETLQYTGRKDRKGNAKRRV